MWAANNHAEGDGMTKSVLIIGGSSRIGQAIAQQCSSEGAVVSVISRQSAVGHAGWFCYQDVLQSEASSQQCIEQVLQQQPDTVFICNGVLHDASGMPEKTIRQLDSEQLAQRLHTNVIIPAQYLRALFGYLSRTPASKSSC